jgi:hypothetical protein
MAWPLTCFTVPITRRHKSNPVLLRNCGRFVKITLFGQRSYATTASLGSSASFFERDSSYVAGGSTSSGRRFSGAMKSGRRLRDPCSILPSSLYLATVNITSTLLAASWMFRLRAFVFDFRGEKNRSWAFHRIQIFVTTELAL